LRTSFKVAALSAILAADLAFFLFFPTKLSNYYDQFFQALPWTDALEMTFLVVLGLAIALLVSFLLVRVLVRSLVDSLTRGNENE
jgi:undecaprenyl pyrophosphate phosphatase UppP